MGVRNEVLVVNPTGSGAVPINDGGNSITVDGEVTIGATALTVLRGIASGITATTDTELLALDAANLYNVVDILVTINTGTAAPAAVGYLALYHGTAAAGTEFARFPFSDAADQLIYTPIHFRLPDRGAVGENVSAKLSAALGANGTFSVTVHAYKTAS